MLNSRQDLAADQLYRLHLRLVAQPIDLKEKLVDAHRLEALDPPGKAGAGDADPATAAGLSPATAPAKPAEGKVPDALRLRIMFQGRTDGKEAANDARDAAVPPAAPPPLVAELVIR